MTTLLFPTLARPHAESRRGRRVRTVIAATAASAVLAACSPDATPTSPVTARPNFATQADMIVTNTNDAGPGSLRQAIADAEEGATIGFDASLSGRTILLPTQLIVQKGVTIEGPLPDGITLSGTGFDRVMLIEPTNPQSSVTLRNLRITGGRAAPGAGIIADGIVRIENSTIVGNVATNGLGIASGDGGGIGLTKGHVTLVNSTVSGNSSDHGGGGIGFYSGVTPVTGSVTLINSTVAANHAVDPGGGIFVRLSGAETSPRVTLRNSIIAHNTSSSIASPNQANCYFTAGPGAALVLVGRNVASDEGCGTGPAMMVLPPGLATGPWLGPLADNGGPTPTHALVPGSPAIDAGLDCTETVDQRYVTRPLGASCDPGAYEFDDYSIVTITIDPSGTVNSRTGVAIVSGTVACSRPTPLALAVSISQARKVGKVNTTVEASGVVQVQCGVQAAWATALTPATGAFGNSPASVTVSTADVPNDVLPASTSSTVKMGWSRK
ncbi:MAG TPA: choice-of-anchor Q domain-containing protein [Gemmatimonadaceae bacterium]|nr:choice-of-anchor Q domain-containing protein [Gemmatimonadaceae bacterium]